MACIYEEKDFSFEGCHPAIKSALISRRMIKCNVWDVSDKQTRWIVYFHGNEDHVIYPYLDSTMSIWKHAEPTRTEKKVKGAVEIMEWLVSNDYTVGKDGNWRPTAKSPSDLVWNVNMWQYCGKDPEADLNRDGGAWNYYSDWLEEIEVESTVKKKQ